MSLRSDLEGIWMDVMYLDKGLSNEQAMLALDGLGAMKDEIVRLRDLVSELNKEISIKDETIAELKEVQAK